MSDIGARCLSRTPFVMIRLLLLLLPSRRLIRLTNYSFFCDLRGPQPAGIIKSTHTRFTRRRDQMNRNRARALFVVLKTVLRRFILAQMC